MSAETDDILDEINSELENEDIDESVDEIQVVEETKENQEDGSDTPEEDKNDEEAEEEDSDDVDNQDDEKVVKIELDGEELELSKKEIQEGFMRDKDYRQKTTEAAEVRKAHFALVNDFDKWVSEVIENFDNSILVTEEEHLEGVLSQIDVRSLNAEELAIYQQEKAHLEQLKAKNTEKREAFKALSQKAEDERKKAMDALRSTERKKLEKALPDFTNENKRKQIQIDISSYLVGLYGEETAADIAKGAVDHKDMLMLYYASLGYKYSKNKDVKKSVIKPKPALRNDTNKVSETSVEAIRNKAIRTGRISDKERDILLDDELKDLF